MTVIYIGDENKAERLITYEIDFKKEGYVVANDNIEIPIEDLIRIEE